MCQHVHSFFNFAAPLLKASPPTSAAVDKTSQRQDLFRQSSPGAHTHTESNSNQVIPVEVWKQW